jgi:hypothetical protein
MASSHPGGEVVLFSIFDFKFCNHTDAEFIDTEIGVLNTSKIAKMAYRILDGDYKIPLFQYFTIPF